MAAKIWSFILILCLAFVCCGCSHQPENPEDQLIYYTISSEPFTLDPQIANDAPARLVILNIFEGLVRSAQNNTIVPGCAESWNVTGDKMMYTFHLRSGLKWSDDSLLTAEDFVYGIRRSLQPSTNSPTAQSLFCIKNAEKFHTGQVSEDSLGVFVADSQTVIIQLEYPEENFLHLLTEPAAMPCQKAFFESTMGQYGREADKLISNGSFYLRKNGWDHDEAIYLRKNPSYQGTATAVPAGVNLTIGKHYDDLCDAIENGETDCGAISAKDRPRAEELGLNMVSFGDTIWGIAFNMNQTPVSNVLLRRGLLSSLNKTYLLRSLPEGCSAVSSIIPENAETNGQSYRQTVGEIPFTPDPSYAQLITRALKEEKLDTFPSLTILCTDDEETQLIVNNMIETWNTVTGTYLNKKALPLNELKDRIADGNYLIAVAPLNIEGYTPLSTLELFCSDSKWNVSALHSQEYDQLTDAVKFDRSLSQTEKIRAAEQYLVDNAVFYPLYIEQQYYAAAKNISGIIFFPYGAEADFHGATKMVDDG